MSTQTTQDTNNVPPKSWLDGSLSFQEKLGDISVHGTDGVEQTNNSIFDQRPVLSTFGIVLQGQVRFALDADWHEVKAKTGTKISDSKAQCFFIGSRRHCQWQRQFLNGNHVRKLTLSTKPSWLETKLLRYNLLNAGLSKLLNSHGAFETWPASEATQSQAETILSAINRSTDLLALDGQVTQLLSCVISDWRSINAEVPPSELTPINGDAAKIMAHIEHRLENKTRTSDLDLKSISNNIGFSVSTIQRLFLKHYECTVNEYIRKRKLEIAREKIIKESCPIGEAAFHAGYNHTSNFTNAFKKAFGCTPGEIQGR